MPFRTRSLRCAHSVAALLAALLAAPLVGSTHAQGRAPTYPERYRPRYHFTPATNWMNDPNGMVLFDGEYHLFYQHNPFGIRWGHMSWGHAVSPDLVRWRHLPVAIPEESGVMAFSGSAVVDWKNTSGFGRDGRPPLVAIYTGHREKNQSQFIAYSTDRGRTWARHSRNPVLDVGSAEFRDPKVFWYEPQQKWVMAVVRATEHKVAFYASPDLKAWTHLSDFGPAGATGGVWECPDLFELPVDGDPTRKRWVLIVNLNPGGVAGGSGGQYFVGDFDGTHFTADAGAGLPVAQDAPDAAAGLPARWLDYGADFYAAVTWSDAPRDDGRRVLLGWMNDWTYGNDIPTAPWRGAMSVPRLIALSTTPQGPRLVQAPVPELERLRGPRRTVAARTIPAGTTPLAAQGVRGQALEIVAEFEPGTADEFGLKVRTGRGQETVIGVAVRAGRLFVDRTRSGEVDFHKAFAARHTAPLSLAGGRVRLRVLVDWSSVEVFANDGSVVLTDQIFPSPASQGVALYAVGGAARLVSLEAWPMSSAW
jgi:fructan beta-fructosidase